MERLQGKMLIMTSDSCFRTLPSSACSNEQDFNSLIMGAGEQQALCLLQYQAGIVKATSITFSRLRAGNL